MNGLSISKTLAAGLGLTLLLGQAAQAQTFYPDPPSGGFNAREVVASENAYRLRDRMQAVIGHGSGSAERHNALLRVQDVKPIHYL